MTEGPRYDPEFSRTDTEAFRFVAQVGPFDVWTQDSNSSKWRFAVFPRSKGTLSFFDHYWQRFGGSACRGGADEETLRVAIMMMWEGPV